MAWALHALFCSLFCAQSIFCPAASSFMLRAIFHAQSKKCKPDISRYLQYHARSRSKDVTRSKGDVLIPMSRSFFERSLPMTESHLLTEGEFVL